MYFYVFVCVCVHMKLSTYGILELLIPLEMPSVLSYTPH